MISVARPGLVSQAAVVSSHDSSKGTREGPALTRRSTGSGTSTRPWSQLPAECSEPTTVMSNSRDCSMTGDVRSNASSSSRLRAGQRVDVLDDGADAVLARLERQALLVGVRRPQQLLVLVRPGEADDGVVGPLRDGHLALQRQRLVQPDRPRPGRNGVDVADLDPLAAGLLRRRQGIGRRVVRVEQRLHRAFGHDLAVVDERAALAGLLEHPVVVAHEHQRHAVVAPQPGEVRVALALEREVAHCEDLVDDEDVGRQVRGDAERQPRVHARRVALHRRRREPLDLRELHRLLDQALRGRAAQARDRRRELRVVQPRQVGVEADAELDERDDPAALADLATGRVRHAGQALQRGALAGAVRPDQRERLAGLDAEGHVVQRLEPVAAADAVAPRHRRGDERARLAEAVLLGDAAELHGAAGDLTRHRGTAVRPGGSTRARRRRRRPRTRASPASARSSDQARRATTRGTPRRTSPSGSA